jgi:hypothetical protein
MCRWLTSLQMQPRLGLHLLQRQGHSLLQQQQLLGQAVQAQQRQPLPLQML